MVCQGAGIKHPAVPEQAPALHLPKGQISVVVGAPKETWNPLRHSRKSDLFMRLQCIECALMCITT